MNVFFLGLGSMGLPMATRLSNHGHTVKAFDTSSHAIDSAKLAGLEIATSVGEGVDGSDYVVLMLPSSAVVESVLNGTDFVPNLKSRSCVVDMGSSNPVSTQQIAEHLSAFDVDFFDAPVSGGVAGAESGTLTIMIGGDDELVGRIMDFLSPLGSSIRHVGPVGAGHALKSLNNLMSATHLLVSSEALIAGRKFGLSYEVMLDVINTSSGRSASTENKWPKYVLPGTYDSGFALRLMAKDMEIATNLQHELGIYSPLSRFAAELWRHASLEMGPDADHTEIVRWLAEHDGHNA